MKTLRDVDIKNKKVLLRCDFNLSFNKQGNIIGFFRLKKSIPTIKYLLQNNATIIIISHLGRPQKEKFLFFKSKKAKYSLKPVAQLLSQLLKRKVKFYPQTIGEKTLQFVQKLKPREIVMLENLRFYRGEEENDQMFAKELAKLGDVYVNDAFAVSHRKHASIVSLPKYLPSCAGLLMEEEVKNLSRIFQNPERPLIGIIGGVKLETKIKVIKKLLVIADHLLIGGKVANTILGGKGIAMGKFIFDPKVQEMLEEIELTNPKLHLPLDGLVSLAQRDEEYLRTTAVGLIRKEEELFDIGPETIKMFSEIIKDAKTIVWNGPLGFVEDPRFQKGTLEIARLILQTHAYSIVGGGETCAFLENKNLLDKFSFASTGGGAMLEFLAEETLPGIEALK